MDKKSRVKSISKNSRENKQLIRKLIKQKKKYRSIENFKKENPDLAADFLYEIRLEDPKAKDCVIENRLKLKINEYMKEEDEKAKNQARLERNRKIIAEQDAKKATKNAKKKVKKGEK